MGLMRYVAKTPVKNTIQIRYMGASVAAPPQVEDKWNNWFLNCRHNHVSVWRKAWSPTHGIIISGQTG
jgi:hypothetical protein